ncbi:MAG: hypothetical protein OXC72_04860 [Roseovarius sp.]|nr:hypothetical protein [Roseovarius sp.]MCY4316283.1 hypothetical protein [Roseovarius sp.]
MEPTPSMGFDIWLLATARHVSRRKSAFRKPVRGDEIDTSHDATF